jgi:hypothetical protein
VIVVAMIVVAVGMVAVRPSMDVIVMTMLMVSVTAVTARLGSEHAARAQGQEMQQGADRAAE